VTGSDAQQALRARREVARLLASAFQPVQQRANPLVVQRPYLCQRDFAGGARQQANPQPLLQLPHAARHNRGIEPNDLCRPGEAERFRHRDESGEFVKAHPWHRFLHFLHDIHSPMNDCHFGVQ